MGPDARIPAPHDLATRSAVRRGLRLAAAAALVALALAAGSFAVDAGSTAASGRLARTGTHTTGVVQRVGVGAKGTEFLHLAWRYPDGTPAAGTVRVTSGRRYRPGDPVTVEYDAAGRVRTDREPNTPGPRVFAAVLPAVLAGSLAVTLLIVALAYLPFLRELRRGAVWVPARTRGLPGGRVALEPDPTAGLVGPAGDAVAVVRPGPRCRFASGTPVRYLGRPGGAPAGHRSVLLRLPAREPGGRVRFVLVSRDRR